VDLKPEPARRSGRSWRFVDVLSLLGPYLGLALVVGIFSVLLAWKSGRYGLEIFLSLGNLKVMLVHASVPAAVALGMTMIMISGGIDLSVGYVVSLVTVTAMLAYRAADRAYPSLATLACITAGLGTGALAGLTNGMMITRLRVVPFVVTLGTMGVARGLAQYLAKGQPVQLPRPAQPPGWMSWLSEIQEPVPHWLIVGPAPWSVLILALLAGVFLKYTVLGRYCYALGSNESTARLCGVQVERTKVIFYALAGLLTGWAGVIQLARSQAGVHDIQAGMELDVIAAVVIGGAA
jgi:ribose transport system permease protein